MDVYIILYMTQSSQFSLLSQTFVGTPLERNYPPKLEVIFCVRGVISPLLANLFLHYAFDQWITRHHREIAFERYADDAIVHCRTREQAEWMREGVIQRLAECGLELNLQKTKIVYCKDANR